MEEQIDVASTHRMRVGSEEVDVVRITRQRRTRIKADGGYERVFDESEVEDFAPRLGMVVARRLTSVTQQFKSEERVSTVIEQRLEALPS